MGKKSKPRPALAGEALARRCIEICEDRKAEDVQLFDVTGASMITDYYLLCSGTSEPHLRAIHNRLLHDLAEDGVRPAHVDGGRESRWIVMDYGTVLVHIFHPELRRYYEIEKLLGDDRLVYRGEETADRENSAPPPPRFRFDLSSYDAS
jgi:ribosome-associated protein